MEEGGQGVHRRHSCYRSWEVGVDCLNLHLKAPEVLIRTDSEMEKS